MSVESELWYLIVNGEIEGEYTEESRAHDRYEMYLDNMDDALGMSEVLLMKAVRANRDIWVKHNPDNSQKNRVYIEVTE